MNNNNNSNADAREFQQLIDIAAPLIKGYIGSRIAEHQPLVDADSLHVSQLVRQLKLELPQDANADNVQVVIEQALKYSVNTQSPRFMDKLYAGVRPVALIAEMLIALLNTNVHVYHVSPYFTAIERLMVQKMGVMMGYDARDCGGYFVPGGSYANLHALVTARNHFFPAFVSEGAATTQGARWSGRTGALQVITSTQAHYSVQHACLTAGLMPQNIVAIACDDQGRIRADLLHQHLQECYSSTRTNGPRPFFLHLTGGSTVLGAFDDIQECVAIARQYSMWVHLDASWGGAYAMSTAHQNGTGQLLKASGLCDSITWNPHKMMGVPLMCSALLMREGVKVLANSLRAGYLYHDEEEQFEIDGPLQLPRGIQSWDMGDGTLGCGRRADAFKLYLTWMHEGAQSFTDRVDNAMTNAKHMYSLVLKRDNCIAVHKPEYANVCFWWLPSLDVMLSLVAKSYQLPADGCTTAKQLALHLQLQHPRVFKRVLDLVMRQLYARMHHRRKFMIDFAPLTRDADNQPLPLFWRVVFNHPDQTQQQCHSLLQEIDACAAEVDWQSVAGGNMSAKVQQQTPIEEEAYGVVLSGMVSK